MQQGPAGTSEAPQRSPRRLLTGVLVVCAVVAAYYIGRGVAWVLAHLTAFLVESLHLSSQSAAILALLAAMVLPVAIFAAALFMTRARFSPLYWFPALMLLFSSMDTWETKQTLSPDAVKVFENLQIALGAIAVALFIAAWLYRRWRRRAANTGDA